MNVVAQLREASKIFKTGGHTITALKKTTLDLHAGEMLLVIGPSGSGKTTLLSLLGCVLYPTEGCVCIQGQNTKELNDNQLARLRRKEIGFVFQNFNLMAPLTASENIQVPLRLNKLPPNAIREKMEKAVSLVGLEERRSSYPRQLSGGEKQRVAVARALVNDPSIILCDEPTASLDVDALQTIMQELRNLADSGKSVAVVTHDPRLEPYADKVISIENGEVSEKPKQGKK